LVTNVHRTCLGFDRLGIYDALSQPVKFAAVPDVLITAQVTTPAYPPISQPTASPYQKEPEKEEVQEPDPVPIGVSEPDERAKKVIDLSASSHQRAVETTETPALTELIEEIGEDNLVTTTTEQVAVNAPTARGTSVATSKKPQQDVYRLLKTLNLTEEETNNLVSQVEKVSAYPASFYTLLKCISSQGGTRRAGQKTDRGSCHRTNYSLRKTLYQYY
ncbi:hypothetical protein OESDEN_18260, partial [Oesophagostomum dentatum]